MSFFDVILVELDFIVVLKLFWLVFIFLVLIFFKFVFIYFFGFILLFGFLIDFWGSLLILEKKIGYVFFGGFFFYRWRFVFNYILISVRDFWVWICYLRCKREIRMFFFGKNINLRSCCRGNFVFIYLIICVFCIFLCNKFFMNESYFGNWRLLWFLSMFNLYI